MKWKQVRNRDRRVDSLHENRAGHRFYVKVNQTRQVRLSIVGFGRLVRGRRVTGGDSHAAQSADPFNIVVDRRELRPDNVISDRLSRHQQRAARKAANRASLN